MVLENVYTALVTPFDGSGEIDYVALKKLVNHLYINGMRGFLIGGTTGEGPTLSFMEKVNMAVFLKKLHEDISIMVGIGNNDTTRSVKEIMSMNENEEIDAYLCVVPYYNCPSQEGILAHFLALDMISKKPIIIYHIPKRCGVRIELDTLLSLYEMSSHIVGIKHADHHMEMMIEVKKMFPEFIWYCGDDKELVDCLAQGADGVISVASHLCAKQMMSLVEQYDVQEDYQVMNEYLHWLSKYLFCEPNPAPIKYLLAKQGFIKNILRLPMTPISDGLAKQLDQMVL